ncbi:hypothetical protein [Roseivirga misakiensis]|uniref:Uncharacterized protein n=1 Tax=Roseivirga misakiensis TaxID=1563681 RepID=A0A1E5T229_9BACT|nr:hypothetical protein [Roseivirga misakiensis]OEK05434.1 hypothetical protein BFP71_18785 [Roseivirga misakiensis]
MKQLRTPEPDDNSKPETDEGKLRRWVSNLQLESWQLELLITGFSIFLLATSINEYESFQYSFGFNKLVATSSSNVIFVDSGRFIINTIPIALKFFLVSLLIHLLLRGFWIGIVGLSSVSNTINIEGLNLKGPFKKRIPEKVRSLDDLIFYLDQVSSVIFAYTYLLAFSIISVVLVASFLFSMLGLGTYLQVAIGSNGGVTALILLLNFLLVALLFIAAIIFFLDTILFSAFKKSKWFSVLYYPIYRFYSVISLSFIYRSIYYHLITNYTKKQIISVSLVLGVTLFFVFKINNWNSYAYYPEVINANEYTIKKSNYDDERTGGFVGSASIPSRYIERDFLPLFIRYSPSSNEILDFLCPEFRGLERRASFTESFNAGVQSTRDTTLTIEDILGTDENYESLVKSSLDCMSTLYEVYLDGELIENVEFFYTRHPNEGEHGIETVLDIAGLARGKHVISVSRYQFRGNPLMNERITQERLNMKTFVKFPFWKE